MMDTEDGYTTSQFFLNSKKSGYGKQLLEFAEKILFDKGCPKTNLLIRADNKEAINFYKAVGCDEDEVISYGKRLIED
jgi:ribosomal protein S18 acetylase RimI-like enzyme